ncbi:MAG: DUF3566 domain-containing protein [Propionibacteriaceae bacterium]|jgi:hypothetical protein|nr:DUF3566 domain-containing protein [Propionibacteriaceae bacterium]
MSKISQSIAASLASRDKRLQRDLPAPGAGSTRPPSDANGSQPEADRPAAQRPEAGSTAAAVVSAGLGAASPASPSGRVTASPASPVDDAGSAFAAAVAPAAPAAPALAPEAKTAAQVASPRDWASPIMSPSPSRPWSQPEAAPPVDADPFGSTVPVDPVTASPAEEATRPAKSDRRFRRFWEKSTADQPTVPPAPTGPSGTAPAEEARPESRTEADQPETGQVSPPDPWQNLPAHHSSTPTGHLGAVPRTAAALPAPVPALAPASLAKPVTPTTIRPATPTSKVRQTRKARLRVARIDPWSVMKTSLLFGVAGAIMMVVAVFVVFSVIDSTGLYQAVNDMISTVLTNPNSATVFDIKTYVNTQRAVGLAALIGVLDVIIITALATVMAFLYNLAANVMGGIEITLAED